jgi:phosphate transport system protein
MIRFDNHAFKGLDDSLKQLLELIHAMGAGVEELMGMLPTALESADADTFAAAKAVDKTINSAEMQVDATVAGMINKFTLIGEDLRFALACIKIAGTLERMADKIKNCTKRLSRVVHPLEEVVKGELTTAVAAARAMVPLTLGQVMDYTPEVSQKLLEHGATVQRAYRTILIGLHAHTRSADDETHILLVAKNLEQAADMAIEIMKVCHFVHTGTKYEKNASA